MGPEPPLTVTFAAPTGDRVAAEVRAIAAQLHLAESEAVALLVGFGQRAMIERGLIGARSSTPMSRSELLRQLSEMVATAEEFDA